MAEVRKASARFPVECTGGDVNFVIAHFTENIPLFELATEFAGRSPVQKAHFTASIIENFRPHLHNLFG